MQVNLCIADANIVNVTAGTPDPEMPVYVSGDLDTVCVFVCAMCVFLMQVGFMMVEAGSVSSINVQNIIFKNLVHGLLSTVHSHVVHEARVTSSGFSSY